MRIINFRRSAENVMIGRSGVSAGEIVSGGEIEFFGQQVTRNVLIYEDKVKTVLYNYDCEFQAGGLAFSWITDQYQSPYEIYDIPTHIQNVADEILKSVQLIP